MMTVWKNIKFLFLRKQFYSFWVWWWIIQGAKNWIYSLFLFLHLKLCKIRNILFTHFTGRYASLFVLLFVSENGRHCIKDSDLIGVYVFAQIVFMISVLLLQWFTEFAFCCDINIERDTVLALIINECKGNLFI